MVKHLLLSCALTPPPLSYPPPGLLFPSCCHGGAVVPALYYLCQQRIRGPIRPSWRVQIVTGLMWSGSLHKPQLGSVLFFSNHKVGCSSFYPALPSSHLADNIKHVPPSQSRPSSERWMDLISKRTGRRWASVALTQSTPEP